MANHFDLSDTEFLDQLQNCSLNADLFSHEAHLRLVWICLEQFGFAKTVQMIPVMIRKYVTHLGAEDKFDQDLTIAAVKIVHQFKVKTKAAEFHVLLEKAPVLLNDFKSLI